MRLGKAGYHVEFYPGVNDRARGWLYLGIVLLTFVVWLVGHWALATYFPLDYGTGILVLLVILAIEILGLYAVFRLHRLQHAY